LEDTGDNQRLAGLPDFLEIKLKPDHEQQENQTDLGDDLDVAFASDPGKTDLRSDNNPGGNVSQNQGLLDYGSQISQGRSRQDADTDT
jgi:hypothetical protein